MAHSLMVGKKDTPTGTVHLQEGGKVGKRRVTGESTTKSASNVTRVSSDDVEKEKF